MLRQKAFGLALVILVAASGLGAAPVGPNQEYDVAAIIAIPVKQKELGMETYSRRVKKLAEKIIGNGLKPGNYIENIRDLCEQTKGTVRVTQLICACRLYEDIAHHGNTDQVDRFYPFCN